MSVVRRPDAFLYPVTIVMVFGVGQKKEGRPRQANAGFVTEQAKKQVQESAADVVVTEPLMALDSAHYMFSFEQKQEDVEKRCPTCKGKGGSFDSGIWTSCFSCGGSGKVEKKVLNTHHV